MLFRILISNDYPAYRETINSLLAYSFVLNNIVTQDTVFKYAAQKTDELGAFLVDGSAIVPAAFDDAELVGFAWLYQYTFANKRRLHLTQIAVDSNHQNAGIGKRLLLMAEDKAKQLGIDEIDLYVMCDNAPATQLYQNSGFTPFRTHMVKAIRGFQSDEN